MRVNNNFLEEIGMVQGGRDRGGFYLPQRRRKGGGGRRMWRTTSVEDFETDSSLPRISSAKDFGRDSSLPRLSMSRRPRSENVQTPVWRKGEGGQNRR